MKTDETFCLLKSIVQIYGTPDAALDAMQRTHPPRKLRAAKKQLCKWLRAYKYFSEGNR